MKLFAFDFETFLIQPYLQAPPPVCMSYAIDDSEPGLVHVKDVAFWELLWQALNDDECVMVAHNAAYEITVLLASVGHIRAWRKAIFAKLKRGGFVCTLLADRLIRIGRGILDDDLALDACMTFNHLEHKLDKKCWWRLRYGTLFNTALVDWPKAAVDYAIGDTCVRELWRSQSRPEYKRFLVTLNAQLEADVFLRLSTLWGFETDHELAVELFTSVKALVKQDEIILAKQGFITWKRCDGVWRYAKNTKKAKEHLAAKYAELGLEPPRGDLTESMLISAYKAVGVAVEGDGKEPTQDDADQAREFVAQFLDENPAGVAKALEILKGNISLNEEACLGYKNPRDLDENGDPKPDPILESYTRYSQSNTLFSKVRRLQFPLIQASFLVLGAATGRTSCRQGEDPAPGDAWNSWGMQLQNPPRAVGVRDCYRGRRRRAIVSCDFDTFELRTLTQQAYRLHLADPDAHPYPKMRDVLMDPKRDVHVELGAVILGITREAAYALKKTDKQAYKDMRQLAKALNFGAPGGLGKATFVEFARVQYDVILTEERAEEVLEIWKDTWPEMRAYLDWASQQLRAADPNSYKEKRKARGESMILGTEMIRGQTSYCDFCNNQFQGLAAAAAKAGFVKLGYEMYDNEDSIVFGCRMLAFVHDEVLVEVPLNNLHDVSHEVARLFVSGAQELVPDVTLTSSPAACYNWSKAAGDPVFDDSGKLMVWEEYVMKEVRAGRPINGTRYRFEDGQWWPGELVKQDGDDTERFVRLPAKLGREPNFDMVRLAARSCEIRRQEAA